MRWSASTASVSLDRKPIPEREKGRRLLGNLLKISPKADPVCKAEGVEATEKQISA